MKGYSSHRPPKKWFIDFYIKKEFSIKEIREILHASFLTIKKYLRFYKIPTRSRTQGNGTKRKCIKISNFSKGNKYSLGHKCSKEVRKKMSKLCKQRWLNPSLRRKMIESRIGQRRSEQTKQKMSLAGSGSNNAMWKGGIKIQEGYRFIYLPNLKHTRTYYFPYMAEHRLVVEQILGRPLLTKEHVHHINKKTIDNRPKNLMAFSSNSAHMKFERGFPIKPEEIIFDGRIYHQNLNP